MATRPDSTPAPATTASRVPARQTQPRVAAYRPISAGLRRWIVLLALATVLGVPWLMIQPHLKLRAAKAARAAAAARAACPPDAASAAPGCPGGRMPVLLLPGL